MKTRLLIAALGLALTNACSAPTEPRPITLEIRSLHATSSGIPFAVVNLTDEVVYIPRCGEAISVAVERRIGGAWINAGAAVCLAANRMDPIRLAPGEELASARGFTGHGRFRLRTGWALTASAQMQWNVVSPAFLVD
jgi:hypothetical protein